MKKILIVEDVPDNAELARKILSASGYRVSVAVNAEEGLERAREIKPDLVLLDLGLPDYDGQTLAGWLRAEAEFASLPIVAFTAWPMETVKQMTESYGCNGYIGKPIVNVKDFVSQVETFLNG